MTTLVEVFDERSYLPGAPKHVATHNNVPEEWMVKDILQRFGIAEHLTVYRTTDGARSIIQHGARIG